MPDELPSRLPRLAVSDPDQLRAMSNLTRQRILGVLTTRTATLGALASELRLARGSVGYHLRVLERAGLIAVAGTATVRGGVETHWSAVAREFDLTAFADQPGAQASVLGEAVKELATADHGGMEYTHVRRVRIGRDTFDSFADRLSRLLAELDEAASPEQVEDGETEGSAHSVTLAVAFFRNEPRPGPAS
jgi:predicted ArsR family transcriptional regulator